MTRRGKGRFVFVDPPSPPGFVSFRHSHGGYGELCRQSRLRLPTLDLFHAASLLLEHGFDAGLVDSVLAGHDADACAGEVAARGPSWVVLRAGLATLPHDLEVARRIKARTGAKVALYGPALAAAPVGPAAGIDAAFAGDGPGVFLELARSGRADGLRGRPAASEDLDALPVPRWELVDYPAYSYVTSQTSWGCPFRCGYCSYPVTQGPGWRTRSTLSVAREFRTLRERYGLRFVMLRDPEFSLERRRTAALCEALIEAGPPIAWGCETRLDTLDEELIALMARAGCLRVVFGVETLNPRALRLMGRPAFSRPELRAKHALLKRHGMLTWALYVIGLPGETRRSTRELVDFALELGTDAASFSMAAPFPGTRLERLARERGWIPPSVSQRPTTSVPSMGNETLSAAEVAELTLEAKARWRGRPGEAGRISGILSPTPPERHDGPETQSRFPRRQEARRQEALPQARARQARHALDRRG